VEHLTMGSEGGTEEDSQKHENNLMGKAKRKGKKKITLEDHITFGDGLEKR